MQALSLKVPKGPEFLDLDLFDQSFLLMVGRAQLKTPAGIVLDTAKKMKDIRLWGPESVVLRSMMLRSWGEHGAPVLQKALDQFKETDDWFTVNRDAVGVQFKNAQALGKKVWADVVPGLDEIVARCQERSVAHFNEQRRAAKKIEFDQGVWERYMTDAMRDHLEWYVTTYPGRVLHPEIQRLVQIVQTNPEFRTMDRDALKSRLAALERAPARYLSDASDVHMGRIWSFTALRQATIEQVSIYTVTAVWDNVTCVVCSHLDGKQFDVRTTFQQVSTYLEADSPASIPFPRLHDVDNRNPDSFRNTGMCPPFHGRCRCDVVYAWTDVRPVEESAAPPPASIPETGTRFFPITEAPPGFTFELGRKIGWDDATELLDSLKGVRGTKEMQGLLARYYGDGTLRVIQSTKPNQVTADIVGIVRTEGRVSQDGFLIFSDMAYQKTSSLNLEATLESLMDFVKHPDRSDFYKGFEVWYKPDKTHYAWLKTALEKYPGLEYDAESKVLKYTTKLDIKPTASDYVRGDLLRTALPETSDKLLVEIEKMEERLKELEFLHPNSSWKNVRTFLDTKTAERPEFAEAIDLHERVLQAKVAYLDALKPDSWERYEFWERELKEMIKFENLPKPTGLVVPTVTPPPLPDLSTAVDIVMEGTAWVPDRLMLDLKRNGLEFIFDENNTRAYFNPLFDRGQVVGGGWMDAKTVAHEIGHAIDSFWCGETRYFAGRFGHWADNAYATKAEAAEYRSWFLRQTAGGKGEMFHDKMDGDSRFIIGNFLDGYEGRQYSQTFKHECGTEWFSVNTARFKEFNDYLGWVDREVVSMMNKAPESIWEYQIAEHQTLHIGHTIKQYAHKYPDYYGLRYEIAKMKSEWGAVTRTYPELAEFMERKFKMQKPPREILSNFREWIGG